MRTRELTLFLLSILIHLFPNCPAIADDVLTYHNDNARTGWNPSESVLTPGNVNASSFGLLFNLPVDGNVDAQPLYVSSAAVANVSGLHDLVIVATEHDSVYAFDADSGTLYWQVSLLGSGETPSDDRGCGQVIPEIGITATPVIDRSDGIYGTNGTIYVVAMSKSGTTYHQRLHALNLASGQGPAISPAEIRASYPGTGPANDNHGHVLFDPGAYKERPGLLLLNGIVYTSWSSHCDIAPYTGWIIGYDKSTLAQKVVLNVDPNGAPNDTFLPDGSGNTFWSSGAGPAADANGNIYALTANGPFETSLLNGFPSRGDYGDSFLKLSTNGSLAVSNYFTPFDQAIDAHNDRDLGSGGVVVLPDMIDANGNTRHLAVGAGKDANIYLVDRDNLGKYIPGATSNSYIYQELANALPGGEWATAAYFNGSVYYGPQGGALRRFTFSQARLNPNPAAVTATVFAYPGVTPSISSSGDSAGIVWAYENPTEGGQAVLHAYDATSLTELYNSNQNPQRDHFGQANKFITPTICNGKVFVGTTNSVGVFGLLNSSPPAVTRSYTSFAADFTGDGKNDLLWRNNLTGTVSIWHMNGTSIEEHPIIGTPSLSWKILGVGDFEGAGKSDILWANAHTGQFSIWFMNGMALTGIRNFGLGSVPGTVQAIGDFSGRGRADLIVRDSVTGTVSYLTNYGAPNFGVSWSGTVAPNWAIVGPANLAGNSTRQLLWRNATTGQVAAWFFSNGAPSQNPIIGSASLSWVIEGAGDVLGNGHDDIIWQNSATGAVSVWQMNGSQRIGILNPGIAGPSWLLSGTADLNGSGVAQIVWRNILNGQVWTWQVTGASFAAAPLSLTPPVTWVLQPASH